MKNLIADSVFPEFDPRQYSLKKTLKILCQYHVF